MDKFVLKVVQMYETFNVRFGASGCGPTGARPRCTGCCSRHIAALNGHENENFQIIHTYVFNPKCIKMGELYGEYNLMTNEWTDGLGSTLSATPPLTYLDKKWVVFGFARWTRRIENTNTVLDDNCTLCLPTASASSSTRERCACCSRFKTWRWHPRRPCPGAAWCTFLPRSQCSSSTWSRLLHEDAPEDLREWIVGLFDKTVDAGLKFLRKHLKESILGGHQPGGEPGEPFSRSRAPSAA